MTILNKDTYAALIHKDRNKSRYFLTLAMMDSGVIASLSAINNATIHTIMNLKEAVTRAIDIDETRVTLFNNRGPYLAAEILTKDNDPLVRLYNPRRVIPVQIITPESKRVGLIANPSVQLTPEVTVLTCPNRGTVTGVYVETPDGCVEYTTILREA